MSWCRSKIENTSCESFLSTLLCPVSISKYLPEPAFNIDNELFLPQVPDKSLIHQSLLVWSPLPNVFCRRLETCTTNSWWASGARRRWRCPTMTWRTPWTARTRRTQVEHARVRSHFEPVCVRDSSSPGGWVAERMTSLRRTGVAHMSDGVYLTSIWKSPKGLRGGGHSKWGEKNVHVHVWQQQKYLCLPLHLFQLRLVFSDHLGSMHGKISTFKVRRACYAHFICSCLLIVQICTIC